MRLFSNPRTSANCDRGSLFWVQYPCKDVKCSTKTTLMTQLLFDVNEYTLKLFSITFNWFLKFLIALFTISIVMKLSWNLCTFKCFVALYWFIYDDNILISHKIINSDIRKCTVMWLNEKISDTFKYIYTYNKST